MLILELFGAESILNQNIKNRTRRDNIQIAQIQVYTESAWRTENICHGIASVPFLEKTNHKLYLQTLFIALDSAEFRHRKGKPSFRN